MTLNYKSHNILLLFLFLTRKVTDVLHFVWKNKTKQPPLNDLTLHTSSVRKKKESQNLILYSKLQARLRVSNTVQFPRIKLVPRSYRYKGNSYLTAKVDLLKNIMQISGCFCSLSSTKKLPFLLIFLMLNNLNKPSTFFYIFFVCFNQNNKIPR